MGKSKKTPRPEKNSVQYLKHLLEKERIEKESLEKKNEQLEKTVDNLKKDTARLTAALEGKFSKEEIKELVVKMVKKRDASLKAKGIEEIKLKPKNNPCPKCGEEMCEFRKFDGSLLLKCFKCRKK